MFCVRGVCQNISIWTSLYGLDPAPSFNLSRSKRIKQRLDVGSDPARDLVETEALSPKFRTDRIFQRGTGGESLDPLDGDFAHSRHPWIDDFIPHKCGDVFLFH